MSLANTYFAEKNIEDYELSPNKSVFIATLVKTVEAPLVVPGESEEYLAEFAYQGVPVLVSANSASLTPSGAKQVISETELNPIAKHVRSGDTLLFSSKGASRVSVSFYTIINSKGRKND